MTAPTPAPAIDLILDSDIGDDVDDVFALLLAARHPDVRLLGVTTVFGQADERARLAGGASNYEEGRPGVIGQAAPVRDFAGTVVAAIGVAYPAMRRTPVYDSQMIQAVREAGEDASRRLGWVHGVDGVDGAHA